MLCNLGSGFDSVVLHSWIEIGVLWVSCFRATLCRNYYLLKNPHRVEHNLPYKGNVDSLYSLGGS